MSIRSAVSDRAYDLLSGKLTPILALADEVPPLPPVPVEPWPAKISDDAASAVVAIGNLLRMSQPSLDVAPLRSSGHAGDERLRSDLVARPRYWFRVLVTTAENPECPDSGHDLVTGALPSRWNSAHPAPGPERRPTGGPRVPHSRRYSLRESGLRP